MSDQWLMRIGNGLAAHFKEPNGASRPGVHWVIGLKHGEKTYKVMVKALLSDNATRKTRRNQEYQAQVAMQYLYDQLANGWHPDQEMEHTICIGNPDQPVKPSTEKPWWKF